MAEPNTEHQRPISYLVRSETRLTKLLVARQAELLLSLSLTTTALMDNEKKQQKNNNKANKLKQEANAWFYLKMTLIYVKAKKKKMYEVWGEKKQEFNID